MKKKILFLILSMIISITFFCELQTVTFLAQWQPQAQFAGYYYAKEKGIYEKYGLDVKILESGPGKLIFKNILPNEVDFFTLFLSGAATKYDEDYKIVNLAQLSQRSALLFVSKKSENILKPSDLNDKKIGIWYADFNELPLSFIRDHDLYTKIIGIRSSINLFLMDGIDAMAVMQYNELDQIYQSGIDFDEINTMYFYDYDYDIPEDGIYCSGELYEKNPDICRKFVEASLEGWTEAFKNKDTAIDIVVKYMKESHIATNKAHQEWMLNEIEKLFIIPGKKLGILNEEDYKRCIGILADNYFIEKRIGFDEFAKNIIEN